MVVLGPGTGLGVAGWLLTFQQISTLREELNCASLSQTGSMQPEYPVDGAQLCDSRGRRYSIIGG